jgi:methylglyoxal synthase
MLDWIREHKEKFTSHKLYATGTTGKLIEKELGMEVTKLKSGPLGGDQQIGALIAENKIDILFFFWDPLEPQPHDPDVKALLRLAVVWNIPVASNIASADFMINSNLFTEEYPRKIPNFKDYIERKI